MNDNKKTKKQLISELVRLRKRAVKYKAAEDEHAKREKDFQESAEKFRLVFENAFDGISIFKEYEDPSDPENRQLVDCNARYAEMAGRNREELIKIGRTSKLAKTISPINFPSIVRGINFRGMFSWLRPDGKDNIIEYTAVPVIMHGQKFTIGIDRDITKRVRMEEALGKEQYLLRTLLDNLPDAIYFKDTHGRFIRINRAHAERWFGLNDPAQAVGKTDFDFFSEEHSQQAYKDEQEIIRTGKPMLNVEERETWPDRSDTWVLTSKMPMRDGEGKIIGTFGVTIDISERKRMEEELRRSQIELEQRVGERTAELVEINTRLKEEIEERKRSETERERLITELQNALADVRTLSGLVPICAHCKKIRNDQGYWMQLEAYIQDRSNAQFSHGICPDCAKELYPEYLD